MKKKIYTLAELEEMNRAFNQRIADARAEIEQNEQDIAAVESKMEIATENGDIPKYKALYTQRADLELNIAAVSAILERSIVNHAAGFSDADVVEAWGAWADQYNGKAAEKTQRFSDMVEQCRTLYREIAEDHDSAESMRDKFAAFTTIEAKPNKNVWETPTGFKHLASVPESNYFFAD